MGGYPFPGHPWHHYAPIGMPSLVGPLVVLLSMLLMLVAMWAARWIALGRGDRARKDRAADVEDRLKDPPASSQAGQDLPPVGERPSLEVVTNRMPLEQPVLASNEERDRAASLLSHAIGEGRLSLEEGLERIDAALSSRHRHELAALVEDLPPSRPTKASVPAGLAPLRLGLLAVAANMVMAAVLAEAIAGIWELWPVAVLALGVSAVLPRPSATRH